MVIQEFQIRLDLRFFYIQDVHRGSFQFSPCRLAPKATLSYPPRPAGATGKLTNFL
jgi:hypothetical protein